MLPVRTVADGRFFADATTPSVHFEKRISDRKKVVIALRRNSCDTVSLKLDSWSKVCTGRCKENKTVFCAAWKS
jgi:hypothetical protein